jgi:hypothetical protein
MRTNTFGRIIGILMLLTVFASCEKSQEEHLIEEIDVSLKAMVELANKRFMEGQAVVEADDESLRVANDGLIDEYTADDKTFSDSRSGKNTMMYCLRSVEPDREERQQLSRALRAYSERNQWVISTYRRNVQDLQQKMENARIQLHAKYQDGEIDSEEYRRQMKILRERFAEALKAIRNSYGEAFSRSYTLLLEHFKMILTDEKWRKLTACSLS